MRNRFIDIVNNNVINKKNCKRFISFVMIGAMALGLTACGSGNGTNVDASSEGSSEGKLQVVTTIFPEYDWVREIVGQGANSVDKRAADKVEVSMLLDNGVDLHSFQPTAADIAKISTCDVFIYVGGESDAWVDDALKEATNKDMVVIDLLDVLGDEVKEEEVVEGMEAEEEDEEEIEAEVEGKSDEKSDEDSEDAETEEITGNTTGPQKSSEDGPSAVTDVNDRPDESQGPKGESSEGPEGVENAGGPNSPAVTVEPGFQDEGGLEEDIEEESEIETEDKETEESESAGEGEADEVEEEDHEDGDGHHHEEGEIEYDEHVWLSLKDAQVLTQSITDSLCAKDPDNADAYKANADAYKEKLAALDSDYQTAVDNGKVDTILFGDRFPFRYMVDDYGINYYAAFVGCSAETEASFETIIFLAGKVDELGLPAICTIEKSDQKIADTVKKNTEGQDQEILTMNSLQSVTSTDVQAGASYLSIMSDNLEVLKKALGE